MNHPFDEFSKSLSEDSVPRRESLRRLGALIAGALLGPLALGLKTAEANPDNRTRRRRHKPKKWGRVGRLDACTRHCKQCRTSSQKDQCLVACRACDDNPRRLNGSCGNYVCCGAGQTYCRGRCVDLKTDPTHCGACGRTCSAGKQCINGRCRDSGGGNDCPAGEVRCGTTCVNLSSDSSNCGSCGNVCPSGSQCLNGTCSGGNECPPGQTRCGTVCVNLTSDAANCGTCGNVCGGSTPQCIQGTCGDCPPSLTNCGGFCASLSDDAGNCGACGNVCPFGSGCLDGVCQGTGE